MHSFHLCAGNALLHVVEVLQTGNLQGNVHISLLLDVCNTSALLPDIALHHNPFCVESLLIQGMQAGKLQMACAPVSQMLCG